MLTRCMARQTYRGDVRWVVVDDCDPETPIAPPADNWTVDIIRPTERWRPGMNTQARNMREALSIVPSSATVLFCEDDDWYGPNYLQVMADGLSENTIFGQSISRKWNLATRMFSERDERRHASLCCTGVRGSALSKMRSIAQRAPRLMDLELWRNTSGAMVEGGDVVSMKCIPGRGGIDSGHTERFGTRHDPEARILRGWIGDDADEYLKMVPAVPVPVARKHHSYRGYGGMRTRESEIQRYVDAYDDPRRRMHMGRRRLADVTRIIRALPKGSLLDVGTGGGEALDIARSAGHTPHGCDANPKVSSDSVTLCAAHSLPFDDGSFDHVTCFDVLEHLVEDDIRPALREMYRVAAKTVTVSASERPSPDGKGGDFHISKRPKAQWFALIRECWGEGARIIGEAGASPAFQVVKQNPRTP